MQRLSTWYITNIYVNYRLRYYQCTFLGIANNVSNVFYHIRKVTSFFRLLYKADYSFHYKIIWLLSDYTSVFLFLIISFNLCLPSFSHALHIYTFVSLEKFGLFFYIYLFFKMNWSLILLVFCTLPDTVSWIVFLIIRWHPLIWLQYSSVQFGEHVPPHLLPNLPGGQDSLQNVPKYPAVHSA